MQIFRFRQSRNGGREYKVHKESDKSMKLKQLADSMSVFIDTFIQENYQESGVNKAWTLRNAVNSLFAQTSYVDQKTGLTDKIWHFETFEAWAKEWRPRLDSSNSQPH